MKIYKQTLLPILIIIYLFISEILSLNISFFKYTDEIVTVILTIYLITSILLKRFHISRDLMKIFYASFLICIIGVISNFINGIQTNMYVIAIGIISFMKLFICCFAFLNIINKPKATSILAFFDKPAKIILVLGFICMIISQFIDIGMRGSQRFGFWSYNFVFGYAHVYSSIVLFLILIIYGNEKNRRNKFYLIIAMLQMLSTTKGPSIIWVAGIIFLLIYMKKQNKIHAKVFVILGVLSLVLGSYQITNYFMNENAPRYLFYKYGAITANRYFPLGSGFSTFGSDMAAENYSRLYVEYGFNHLYGMSENDKSFLNDNYWPMVYAQFGWIGFFLALYILYTVFRVIQRSKISGRMKGFVFSIYFFTILHSLGSSLLVTSCSIVLYIGVILFIKGNWLKEEKSEEE